MDAIVLFSHGSVLCGAEENLLELASRMRMRGDAPIVEVGFLDYNEPSFAAAVDKCIAQGGSRIVVVPYFLIAGKFVTNDLPERIAAAKRLHRDIEFVTAGPIGFHPALADAVMASAAAALPPRTWRDRDGDVNQWCRENPKCPLYATNVCRVRGEVTA